MFIYTGFFFLGWLAASIIYSLSKNASNKSNYKTQQEKNKDKIGLIAKRILASLENESEWDYNPTYGRMRTNGFRHNKSNMYITLTRISYYNDYGSVVYANYKDTNSRIKLNPHELTAINNKCKLMKDKIDRAARRERMKRENEEERKRQREVLKQLGESDEMIDNLMEHNIHETA